MRPCCGGCIVAGGGSEWLLPHLSMDAETTDTQIPPWNPFTFRGVAAYADLPFTHLLLAQILVALLTAGSVACLFERGWRPSIESGVNALPEVAGIRGGLLDWSGPTPARLGAGPYVSLVIDPQELGGLGREADIEISLLEREFRVRMVAGHLALPYPRQVSVDLSRVVAQPWWGAWHGTLLAGLVVGVIAQVTVTWWMLAALYAWPLGVLAFYADRRLTLSGAWKLAAAALLPGAVLMDAAILAYAFRYLVFFQLLSIGVIHFAVGWAFAIGACMSRPRLPVLTSVFTASPSNPFTRR